MIRRTVIALTALFISSAATADQSVGAEKFTNDVIVTITTVNDGPVIKEGPLAGCAAVDRGNLKKGVPNSQWCNAVFIHTGDVNRTSAFLRYAVTCAAYDKKSALLGRASSANSSPDMDEVPEQPWYGSLKSFERSGSLVRIPNIKLDDVARVECRAFLP